MNKQLTLSIIIPVYNEEHYIRSCLDSISRQTRMPDEVIVVDNNCTDKTIEIARGYEFVRIVTEKKQGRGNARSAGFDAAKGDIIGRIDVDSVLDPDWCERVIRHFAASDIGGLTGLARTAILPRVQWPKSVLWSWMYTQWATTFNGFELMWGANMAIRRDVWQKVRTQVCNDDQLVHEDQDISILVLAAGYEVRRDNSLLIGTDGQTFHYFPKLVYYTKLRFMTIGRHKRSGVYKHIPKRFGWMYRVPRLAIAPFVFGPFFIVSLIFWPLDSIIRAISKTIFRTT